MKMSWLKYPVIFFLLGGTPPIAWSQADDSLEYGVKLAFLYRFAQFIEWPADAFHDSGSPITICVAGLDPFAPEAEQDLRQRKVSGHPMDIRSLKRDDDPKVCQVVFIPASENKRAGEILKILKTSSVVTVGETEGFASFGGVIKLTRDEHTLRFEINLDAATYRRLQISSRLLALARIVRSGVPFEH